MPLQHIENLLRRYKGERVTIKTISGAIHVGIVTEITNDFVELVEEEDGPLDEETPRVYLLFQAMESVIVSNPPAAIH